MKSKLLLSAGFFVLSIIASHFSLLLQSSLFLIALGILIEIKLTYKK